MATSFFRPVTSGAMKTLVGLSMTRLFITSAAGAPVGATVVLTLHAESTSSAAIQDICFIPHPPIIALHVSLTQKLRGVHGRATGSDAEKMGSEKNGVRVADCTPRLRHGFGNMGCRKV